MSNQALFGTLLEVGVEGLGLEELYPREDMGLSSDQRPNSGPGELEDAVWEQHHKLQEINEQAIHINTGHEPNSPEIVHLSEVVGAHHARGRSHSISFVNPFFPDRTVTHDAVFSVPANICSHQEEEEAADQVYEEWNQYHGPAVAPGHFMIPQAHQHVLESVYQDIGAQISRRFSLACPPGGGFELPLPGHPQPTNNLQFVMEDPSGKENQRDSSIPSVEQGRRHSMGAPHLYCCPWTGCNKVFNRFYNLRSHYRIHSGEKPFTCNYCDAAFARNHDLKRHERIHLKTKPYVCPTCNKAFSRNDAMNRHVRLNSCSRSGN